MKKPNALLNEQYGKIFRLTRDRSEFSQQLLDLQFMAEKIHNLLGDPKTEIDVKKIDQAELELRTLIEQIHYLKGLYG